MHWIKIFIVSIITCSTAVLKFFMIEACFMLWKANFAHIYLRKSFLDFNEIFEKFTKLGFLYLYKITASYHVPFCPSMVWLAEITYFFSKFLLTKNIKTLFFKTAKTIYKFYTSNESLWWGEVLFVCLDLIWPWCGTISTSKVPNFLFLSLYNHLNHLNIQVLCIK